MRRRRPPRLPRALAAADPLCTPSPAALASRFGPAGGEIVSTFDHPELVTLGECDVIEEVLVGDERMIRFSGVKAGEACT